MLAADAKLYAEHLVATGEFAHPSADWVAAHPTGHEGENLAGNRHSPSSPSSPSSMARMQQGWIAEKNSYQGKPSATGGTTTGHYAQMVWRTTTAVGCGIASAGGYDVLSCRYSPPGNIIGQKPY
jgi:pathogenesis-related protein 1